MGNGSQPVQMTDAQLHAVVKETVEQVFLEMGIRVDSPSAIIEYQEDQQFVRELRETTETIKRRGIGAMVTLLIAGVAAMVWLGFKSAVTGGS